MLQLYGLLIGVFFHFHFHLKWLKAHALSVYMKRLRPFALVVVEPILKLGLLREVIIIYHEKMITGANASDYASLREERFLFLVEITT